MKKFFKSLKIKDIIFYTLIILFLAVRVPLYFSQSKSEGITLKKAMLETSDLRSIGFPKKKEKSILIFWATWCGPCSFELNRINNAIIEKEIDSKYIYAINMGEDPEVVKKEVAKKDYKFSYFYNFNNELLSQLNIEVTPTIVFLTDEHKVEWITSGISPTLIYRMKKFIKD